MSEDNVVALNVPKADAALVEKVRTLLSDVQNGRVTELAAVFMYAEGEFGRLMHFNHATDAIAGAEFLKHEAMICFLEGN